MCYYELYRLGNNGGENNGVEQNDETADHDDD